jgi:hypothetical protein
MGLIPLCAYHFMYQIIRLFFGEIRMQFGFFKQLIDLNLVSS